MYFKIALITVVTLSCVAVAYTEERSDNDLVDMINRIDNEKSLYLYGGLTIERSKSGRSVPVHSDSENLLERAERYLQTHELRFAVPEEEEQDDAQTGRSQTVAEARTGKLKKLLIPLLLALKFKLAVIIPMLLLVVKFISLKGLATGLLALVFSAINLFKDMSSGKKERVTTAYITGNPLNAEIVHSDWNRNGQAAAQDLAYNYHTIQQPMY